LDLGKIKILYPKNVLSPNGYDEHVLLPNYLLRSKSKATFPGMFDNMVAGGIGSGVGIFETMVKECEEEAGIPESLAKKAVPVGMIRCVAT